MEAIVQELQQQLQQVTMALQEQQQISQQLQQQMQEAQPAPPPFQEAPAPAPAPPSNALRVSEPEPFDGQRSTYYYWRLKAITYVNANSHIYTHNRAKVLYILNRLTGRAF